MEERTAKEREVRDYLIDRVLNEIPYCRLNGDKKDRLPNNANFSFQFVEGESLLIKLDMKGICGSSGSACTSGSLDPSHVLLAIGLPHEIAHGSLRMTLRRNNKEDIDYVVDNLKEIVAHLRKCLHCMKTSLKNRKNRARNNSDCVNIRTKQSKHLDKKTKGGIKYVFSEKVMDHFQHPRNVGEIENASGVGTVGNAKCGDIMRIYLDIDDNGSSVM